MTNPLTAAIRFYKLRSSWLGEGGQPVSRVQATNRSQICLQCPKNQPHPIWEMLSRPAARELRSQIELKASMKLAVPDEDGLRVCDGCMCVLPLKVWVPLNHIIQTTPLDDLQQDNPRCWILAENQP